MPLSGRRVTVRHFPAVIVLFFLHSLFLFLGTAFAVSTVQVNGIHSRDAYPAGGTYPFLLQLCIQEGYSIHETGTEDGDAAMIPTRLSFQPSPGIEIQEIRWPEPETVTFPYLDEPVRLFRDTILVWILLSVDEEAAPGSIDIQGTLSYQACTDQACLPPGRTAFEFSLNTAPPGASVNVLNEEFFQSLPAREATEGGIPGAPFCGAGFCLTLIGLFLGGLALNLTPCIYPLIPITVSYFGGREDKGRGRTLIHGALYMAGLAVTNSLLGLFAALSGGLLGAALQSPWVLGSVAIILLALALSFFGVWEIRIPAGLSQIAARQYSGYFGTFFMGLTLGVVAAPCLGPFILGLLAYVGQSGDPLLGFVYFFVLSLGMGLPLACLGVFSGALKRLPGSGDWMVWVRGLLGWVLVGMAAYMIRPLLPGSWPAAILLGAVAVAAGVHLGWLDRTGATNPRFRRFRHAVGVVLIGIGAFYAFSAGGERAGVVWKDYGPALLAQAKDKGRPVMLDFSAAWCVPCREMEEKVFTDPEVVALSRKIETLKVNLTRRSPGHKALLERYRVRGVPTIVFVDRNGRAIPGLRVEAFVAADDLASRMKRLLGE